MSKLYYERQSEIETEITDRIDIDGVVYYRFADELFYPGGGGQPHDNGSANGAALIDCVTVGEMNYYAFEHDIGQSGAHCVLDADFRSDVSIQHTAQHLISALFSDYYDAATDSFHLGASYCSIELKRTDIDAAAIKAVEDKAALIIRQNVPVVCENMPREAANALSLRKPLSVEDDIVRIVKIGNIDISACGGTHTQSTGEIGLIKIIKSEHKHDVTRIFFLAGARAFTDYQSKSDILSKATAKLSCQNDELYTRIERELQKSAALKKEVIALKNELCVYIADKLLETGESVLVYEADTDMLGILAQRLRSEAGHAFIGLDRDAQKIILVQCELRILSALIDELKASFDVTGGGNDTRAQIAYSNPDELEDIQNRIDGYFYEV